MNYRESPAYQRMIQRLGKIRPENRHLLNNMISPDARFAGDMERRGLQAKRHGANVDYANRSLALQRDSFEEGERQENLATAVGLGNVAASAHFGLGRDKIDMEILRRKLAFMKKFGV